MYICIVTLGPEIWACKLLFLIYRFTGFEFQLYPPSYTCIGAGVLHIVEQILQSLDVKSLVMSEQVSSIWRDVIEDLHIWKHLIKNKIVYDPLWKALFKRRGW